MKKKLTMLLLALVIAFGGTSVAMLRRILATFSSGKANSIRLKKLFVSPFQIEAPVSSVSCVSTLYSLSGNPRFVVSNRVSESSTRQRKRLVPVPNE